MGSEAGQKLACLGQIVGMNAQPGVDEGADQPSPDSALMVSGVAGAEIAKVAGLVIGMARSQRTQADRGKQTILHHLQDGSPAVLIQDWVTQGNREDLVRPAGGIIAVILANIVAFFLMRMIGKNLDA